MYLLHIPNLKEVPPLDEGIRVISYNLKYAGSDYDQWLARKDSLIDQIISYKPDIVSIQEGDIIWMDALKESLQGYDYVGVGREDGKSSGEYAAIFYNTRQVKLLSKGDFWLSETPTFPSVGWDASTYRICSWGSFQVLGSEEVFKVYNTHLDHKGKEARKNSSQLIIDTLKACDVPALITGDFNFYEGSKNYKMILQQGLFDSKYKTDDRVSYGSLNWFIAFNQSLFKPIDFCFVNEGIEVIRYRVDNQLRNKRQTMSDHYPLIIDIKISHTD